MEFYKRITTIGNLRFSFVWNSFFFFWNFWNSTLVFYLFGRWWLLFNLYESRYFVLVPPPIFVSLNTILMARLEGLHFLPWQLVMYKLWKEKNNCYHNPFFFPIYTIKLRVRVGFKSKISAIRLTHLIVASTILQLWLSNITWVPSQRILL